MIDIIFQSVNHLALSRILHLNEALPVVLSYDDQQFYFILPFSAVMSFQNSKLYSLLFSSHLLTFSTRLHYIFFKKLRYLRISF